MPEKPEQTRDQNVDEFLQENRWMIRPCHSYSEEYDECTCIKARFHQYFINGKNTDCSQWKIDFKNCERWEDNKDKNAAVQLIESEAERRKKRLDAHYDNNIWEKRSEPPADWAKPMPEWMQKQYEASYLAIKAKELKENKESDSIYDNRTFCSIM